MSQKFHLTWLRKLLLKIFKLKEKQRLLIRVYNSSIKNIASFLESSDESTKGSFFLLLLELIIFSPQVFLPFTWVYFRLDAFSRKEGKQLLIFDNEPPEIFDYFEISAKQILQFDPVIVKSRSIGMRLLLITHSIMMLDLLALVISRAVSLTSCQY